MQHFEFEGKTTEEAIENARNVENVILWSITGRKVLEINGWSDNQVSINLSHVPSGLYVVEFQLKGGRSEYRKVIKQW